jgi:signal transduction histidine kinase
MERGEELMELNRAAIERNEAAFDRNTLAFERVIATLDRQEQMFEENRLFIREMNRRNERVAQDLIKGNRQFMGELSEELRGKSDAILAALEEVRDESKAQTQALLALIDRMPPAGRT